MPSSARKKLADSPDALLPIRTVSDLTGVNSVTLRAWERRYNLITPQRTPKGHRLYTQADVELINQVLELLEQGVSISQVKPLLEQAPGQNLVIPTSEPGEVWKRYQEKMIAAIESFDEGALDSAYNDALSLYPIDVVSQRLTTPLLRILGERWQELDTGIAEEHFFSVYLRNKLGTRIHHINQNSNGPLLLMACLPGEFHEIGLLFFALTCANFGYRTLVLGANLPLQQIPAVLSKKSCIGIVLSGASRPSRGVMESDLPDLVNKVKVPVFVGGRTAVSQQKKIEAAGAVFLGETVGTGVKIINQTLKKKPRR